MSDDKDAIIEWKRTDRTDSRPFIRLGLWSVGVTLLVFLVWAAAFPLASAIVTSGSVVAEGRNKLVQHESGGTIIDIAVRDGDFVTEGQELAALNVMRQQADLTQLQARATALRALMARLDAERHPPSTPAFVTGSTSGQTLLRGSGHRTEGVQNSANSGSALILRGADGAAARIERRVPEPLAAAVSSSVPPARLRQIALAGGGALMESQRKAFEDGRRVLESHSAAQDKKIARLESQLESVRARLSSQQSLLEMSRDELRRLEPLARDGLIARNRIGEKRRKLAELESAVTTLRLEAQSTEAQIEEVQLQKQQSMAEAQMEAAREYSKIAAELEEISDQLVAARKTVSAAIIRAPATGTITKLEQTTIGGVLGNGDVFAEIVPHGAPLVVEAKIMPGDIDHVAVGQAARIAVTAFDRKLDDEFAARVIYRAADATFEKGREKERFFVVRLALEGSDRAGNRMGDLRAGMEAEVYIQTGSRTFLAYIARPFTDSFKRAFKER